MRHNWCWIFLIVVRWQPVVFSAHKSLEEPPRAPGDEPRKSNIVSAQEFSFSSSRLAHEVSDKRRKHPDDKERAHDRQSCRLQTESETERDQRQQQSR